MSPSYSPLPLYSSHFFLLPSFLSLPFRLPIFVLLFPSHLLPPFSFLSSHFINFYLPFSFFFPLFLLPPSAPFSPVLLSSLCSFLTPGVFVTTGASACAVNTRRRPDDAAALLVSPRRREPNFKLKPQRAPGAIFSVFALVSVLFPSPSRMDVGARKDCFLLPWPLYCFIVYFIARIFHGFYAFSTRA